jgi:AcrR family transcriptional regulator
MKSQKRLKKGEQTRIKMLEAAIRVLGMFGEHGATFQKIADACGVSQPLVVHYFKSRNRIFPEVITHLMEVSLIETEKALSDAGSARKKLTAYFRVSLEFIRRHPDLGRIYMMLYYLSNYDSEIGRLNDRLKREAVARVAEILAMGAAAREFEVSEIETTAKIIHTSLTGLILNAVSDQSPQFTDSVLLRSFERFCDGVLTAQQEAPKRI